MDDEVKHFLESDVVRANDMLDVMECMVAGK